MLPLKSTVSILCVCAIGVLTLPSAGADEWQECLEQAEVRPEITQCLALHARAAEGNVERAVADTNARLREQASATGRPEVLYAFVSAQAAYERFVARECTWAFLQVMPGTGAGDADLACRVSLNNERAERLRQLGQGSTMPVPEDDFATLVDAEWRLLTIDGDAILDETQPTLQFAPDDRRVAGNATANRFMGSFVRTGSGLAFGPLATTMMLREHPEGAMEQERRYLSVLGEIDAFKLADARLELLQDGRVRLVFAPTPADEG